MGGNIMKKRWPALLAILVLVIGVFVYLYFLHPETVPMWAEFDPSEEQPAQSQNQDDSTNVEDTTSQPDEETTTVFTPIKTTPKVEEPTTYMLFGRDRVVKEENGQEVEMIETDLILTATLNPSTRNIDVQFIPPNTVQNEGEIKHLYSTEGIQSLETAVEELTGQKVHNYIGVDYESFVQLIDVLGGIEVKLDEVINMPKYGLILKPGLNTLNGEETLKLIRLKWGKTTIIERIERQKLILSAIYQKMREMRNLSELKEVSDAMLGIREDLLTDLDGNQVLKGFQFFTQGLNYLNVEIIAGELVENEWIPTVEK